MQRVDTTIKAAQPVCSNDPRNKDQGKGKGNFQQILESKLSRQNKRGSTKTRAEYTGVLTDCNISIGDSQVSYFKLETYNIDLLLRVKGSLLSVVEKHLWDEVKVRGFFDETGTVLIVESVIPIHIDDGATLYINDSDWEVERFRRRLLKNRSIEPSIELMAS